MYIGFFAIAFLISDAFLSKVFNLSFNLASRSVYCAFFFLTLSLNASLFLLSLSKLSWTL